MPTIIKVRTTNSFIATMILLNTADSLMPMTSRTVMIATMIMAGTLRVAPVLTQPSVNSRHTFIPASGGATWLYGAEVKAAGMEMPQSFRNWITYPDQPTATVEAAKRYSRIKSQPMIQAINSPRVA